MNSSIFFRNLTCCDGAIITSEGKVEGRSYHVSAEVTGKVTEDESVVLDFSAGKKQIKSWIDDNVQGFDHKLVINPRSKCVVKNVSPGMVLITTPYLEAKLPLDAIQYSTDYDLSHSIQSLLTYNMPEYKFKIYLDQKGFTNSTVYFNYAHGLKNSSSYGCQNALHGHTSFVEVVSGNGYFDTETERKVANLFHNKILLFKENIVKVDGNTYYTEFETAKRGTMKVKYVDTPVIILDTESTIEYMIEHAAKTCYNDLKGKTLMISEGLQKGSRLEVK